jgi:hypothetical protein
MLNNIQLALQLLESAIKAEDTDPLDQQRFYYVQHAQALALIEIAQQLRSIAATLERME